MRTTCLILAGWTSLFLTNIAIAIDAARFDGGDGHLAIQIDEASAWRRIRPSDEIAGSGRLRTSPVGVTRIHLGNGTLFLCPNTEAILNVSKQQINLVTGKLRLVMGPGNPDWRIIDGRHIVVCPADTDVAVAAGQDAPEVHVLAGTVRVLNVDKESLIGTFTAPSADILHQGKRPSVLVPADQVKEWTQRINTTTEPRPAQGVGQLVAKDSQSGSPVRLEIARYHVNVVLQPPVALVQIDQSFFNPYGSQQEGTFIFNLPPGASVSRFAMFVTHESLIEGELIDRRQADQIYTSIVRAKRDPAILEQIGDNLFRMRVFPIPGRDTKRILLDYTLPMAADHGQFRFDLPLMSDLKPIWDFSLAGTIHPPLAEPSVFSPTHPDLKFESTRNGAVTFQSRAKSLQPPPFFSVRYVAPQSSEPSIRSYSLPGKNTEFFTVTMPESMNPDAIEPPASTDVLLLVDTSGQAKNLSRARLAARTVISGMSPKDRVRIGCVDVAWKPLTEGWRHAVSPDITAGLKKLDDQFALGANDLDTTLKQAYEAFKDSPEERRRVAVYIGDGPSIPSMSRFVSHSAEGSDRNNAEPAFFVVRIGNSSVGDAWLTQLAMRSGGSVFEMKDKVDSLGDLFEWSLSGLPSPTKIDSIKVAGMDEQDLYHDAFWPRGRELHLYGRRTPHNSLRVSIAAAGRDAKSFEVPSTPIATDDGVFTGRMWAQQKLRSMLDQQTSKSDAVKTEIVQLCQEWSLMSPFTAFLVLETEQDYERWKIDRKVRHRYWKPTGSIAAIPIPPEMLRNQPPVTEQANTVPSEQPPQTTFDQHMRRESLRMLDIVEKLLMKDRPEQAQHVLTVISERARYYALERYNDLNRRVLDKLRPVEKLADLKLWRPIADRRVADILPASSPLLLQFAHGGVSQEFLDEHPHARELMRTVTECPQTMTIKQFVDFVGQVTGVPVLLDRNALQDEGISIDTELDLENLNEISVRSLMGEALNQVACKCVPERFLLRITTQTKADEKMFTRVYPVKDLIQAETMPPPHRLANPYLDMEVSARRRIESKMKSFISVDLNEKPLNLALAEVAEKLGTRIHIDKQSLHDEGISDDQQVSLQLPSAPAEVTLKELLNPLALTTIIRNETLHVVTQTKADEVNEARLYCTAGLIRDLPAPPRPPMANFLGWNSGMLGWFGGGMGEGMGGMGGGMGGFGGPMAGMNGVMVGGVMGGGMGFGGPQAVFTGVPAFTGQGDDGGTGIPLFDSESPASDADGTDASLMKEAADARDNKIYVDDDDEMVHANLSRALGSDSQSVAHTLEQSTSGKWSNVDGEGGAISYFPLSSTIVMWQTAKVHRESAEVFAQLRRQLIHPVVRRNSTTGLIERSSIDFRSLMTVIQQSTRSRWNEIDGEGGSMSPNTVVKALPIRQTAAVHEQIARLFTQLRRARYVAESLPYLTSLDGIDDLSLFDRPTFTELPRNAEATRQVSTPSEEKWLTVRRTPASASQRWRSVSTATGQRREFTIRKDPTRVELTLPGRILRAEGARGAVAYPGLSLVELDAWGDAIRQLADASLPWLPHRSNEELADLFDITLVEENSKIITLRLNFPGIADTYLQPTFSKLTRQPIKWLAVAGNELQFELQFDLKTVTAIDSKGHELERWELIAEESQKAIPSLTQGWGDFHLFDAAAPDTHYSKARESLRRGDYSASISHLTQALAENPTQPLLNFLLAWCAEFGSPSDAARVHLTKTALEQVAISNAEDLLRLMTTSNFPSLGNEGLESVLLTIPAEKRSGETWNQLAEIAHHANKPAVALAAINRAVELPTDLATKARRQVLRIELLLRTSNTKEAEATIQQIDALDLSDDQTASVADIFARFGRHGISDMLFKRVIERSRAKGPSLVKLQEHQAEGYPKGKRRWELFLNAAKNSARNGSLREYYLDRLLREASDNADAIVLGEFAAACSEDDLQTKLKLRQAELLADRKQAGIIVRDLFETKRIPAERFLWGLTVLQEADLDTLVVQLAEARLRAGRSQTNDVKRVLFEAYTKLGRKTDAIRAATDTQEEPAPKQPQAPQFHGGGNFF